MQRFVICSDGTLQTKQQQLLQSLRVQSSQLSQAKDATDGSTTTGISAAQLDVSTVDASDLSHPLKIVGILDDAENKDFTTAGIPLIVMINNHALVLLVVQKQL